MIDKNISRILKERRSVFPKQFNGEIIAKSLIDFAVLITVLIVATSEINGHQKYIFINFLLYL